MDANQSTQSDQPNVVKIGGRNIVLAWTNETQRRYKIRIAQAGGHPTKSEMTSAGTAEAAFMRMLWALLPREEAAKYVGPMAIEDMAAEINEDDLESVFKAVARVFDEAVASDEKKSDGETKPPQG